MYKAMIVDDERLIREGLAGLIAWEEHGFRITAVARDGYDALAGFDRERPDLVITDIRMPGMDGLELVDALRRQDPVLHVLVLSGFAEFDYAKRALMSRVDGYLLKPVDEDELIAQLDKIRTELDRRREEARFGGGDAGRLEDLIQALASGTLEADQALTARVVALGLDWTQFQVVLVEPRSEVEGGGDAVVQARQALAAAIDPRRTGLVFPLGRRVGILLRQTWSKDQALDQLHCEIAKALGGRRLEFDAAIGPATDSLSGVAESSRVAGARLSQAFFAKGAGIIAVDCASAADAGRAAGPGPAAGSAVWNLPLRVERLSYALDARNAEALGRALEETVAAMRAFGLDQTGIKSGFAGLAGALTERWLQTHPGSEEPRDALGDWMAGIWRQERLANLVVFMRRRLEELWQRDNPAGTDSLVDRMKDLIERHSADSLRLETLAEAFGYNSAYLGKVFKAKTGEYFNTWLDKVRVEKAKELLERGLKVYQAAQMVGYADADYFQMKFKKITGITPSAWKGRRLPE